MKQSNSKKLSLNVEKKIGGAFAATSGSHSNKKFSFETMGNSTTQHKNDK